MIAYDIIGYVIIGYVIIGYDIISEAHFVFFSVISVFQSNSSKV